MGRSSVRKAYLGDHHMTIKRAIAASCFGPFDVRANLSHHWSTECHVGHEMAIHDIDVQPVCIPVDDIGTGGAEVCKIRR